MKFAEQEKNADKKSEQKNGGGILSWFGGRSNKPVEEPKQPEPVEESSPEPKERTLASSMDEKPEITPPREEERKLEAEVEQLLPIDEESDDEHSVTSEDLEKLLEEPRDRAVSERKPSSSLSPEKPENLKKVAKVSSPKKLRSRSNSISSQGSSRSAISSIFMNPDFKDFLSVEELN